MEAFHYANGTLRCEQVELADVAGEFGTPSYVYSRAQIEGNFRALDEAFADIPHIICYSLKANSNLAIGRIMAGLGAGADIVSGGELFKALKMGMDAHKIVYASVGKTAAEIEDALKAGILMFNVESRAELEAINEVAGRVGVKAPVALRINPEIDPQTHPYITTGMTKYKFGIPAEEGLQLYHYMRELPNVAARGIQMHIGSQLVSTRPIVEAATKVATMARRLKGDGIALQYVNIGGGLGIRYKDETPEGPKTLAKCIVPMVRETGGTLIMEPGRFIVGNAGVLLTRVLYIKRNPAKKFVIVDAAMNDLIRPSLYDAYHPILNVRQVAELDKVDVVGPVCESGDFFAHDREVAKFEAGDLMSIQCAGAYGYAMSSNYNCRLRPAEVLVSGKDCRLVRRRESYEDLVRAEEL